MLTLGLLDEAELRILTSLPGGPVHDPDDCPLCQLEELRLYDLNEQLRQRTRLILRRL